MSARSTRLLNRGLAIAIVGGLALTVLSIPTRSPPGEQQSAPAPAEIAPAPGVAATPVAAPGGALFVPVAGVTPSQLVDTYTDARGSGRRHDAIDIMAPRGTPIVAAAAGTVEKLYFSNGGGGISVYVRSADRRWVYYYAHLEGYAPGLAEGQQVRAGAPLGFVGSTGNANPEGPHLHFAINAVAEGERWWQGTPINPYPVLTGSGAR